MLKINRIKGLSKTDDGNYGFDYVLTNSLNLISSSKNTRGKSSVIVAIYYCLGLEEIIGGKGMKTLTCVYKNSLTDDDDITHSVLESEVWLEITNGTDVITLLRTGKMNSRNENLISVYFSDMESINLSETYVEDMYVHSHYSATSKKGFHSFLEKFLELQLPLVPASDGKEFKLYIQLLFSCIFIEQKRGWADLFSAMPIMSIKDAKKRVIEYILALDTLSNEKKRVQLKSKENEISSKWKNIINEIRLLCERDNCIMYGLSPTPKILDDDFKKSSFIKSLVSDEKLEDTIINLENEKEKLIGITPKVVDNYDLLQAELDQTEESIKSREAKINSYQNQIVSENTILSKLTSNLDIIKSDIQNNKDALKLKNMGSNLDVLSYSGVCPTCHQDIEDSLLPSQTDGQVMTIEENIKHLQSQQDMVLFAFKGHEQKKRELEENYKAISANLFTLRRLAKAIRNDLYSIDEEISESIVYKRVQLESDIQKYSSLTENVSDKLDDIFNLSNQWREYLSAKEKLPKNNFSKLDSSKIFKLETKFKHYLNEFNYHSASDLSSISISRDTYLPVSEGFDMKFDSSASDNIRAIWAYTLALLVTSNELGGNHPKIILFDEPAQHSIITEDVVNLFNQVNELTGDNQVILGITLNDTDIRDAVSDYDEDKIHVIDVGNHSFKKII